LPLAGLPVRVASFSFQGPDPSKVQLLIHADIGRAYGAAENVAVAYLIADAGGRVVDSQSGSGRLAPAVGGIPSPLVFVAGSALRPGEYTLKLAAAEGGHVGSVEHPIHASLVDAGGLKMSDLTVGGPLPSGGEPTRPSVDYTVRFGIVHAYVEAYGTAAANARVRFDILPDQQSQPLVTQEASSRSVNESRVLFSTMLRAGALPPGAYRLRATVTVDGGPGTTLSRPFEVPGLTTASTAGSPAASAPGGVLSKTTEIFLPVESGDLALPFRVTDALGSDILEAFQPRVPAAAAARFNEGVEHLRSGDYAAAATSFKAAILPNMDFTAATAYLGVCLAATGHDADAAGAWQTALIGGSDLPHIHVWLGNALLRTRDLARARNVLERAASRWPADTRFARPLAMLNATTGRGLEAFQMLQKYLAANGTDPDALYLGVQWLYQIHENGGVVGDRASDLALARTYGADYARVNGPKQPLVQQWLNYLMKAD
jgi:TolA-binding protein